MRRDTTVGHDGHWHRRAVLAAGTAGWVMMTRVARAVRPPKDEEGVTAPEDLMQEPGVLHRCLLMYEEGRRRVQAQAAVSSQVVHQTADLVHRCVEMDHEHHEAQDIFPVFQKAGKLTDAAVHGSTGMPSTGRMSRTGAPALDDTGCAAPIDWTDTGSWTARRRRGELCDTA